MAKHAVDWIPHNIVAAAEKAGVGLPLGYVGRNNGHEKHPRQQTLGELADQSSEREASETSRKERQTSAAAGDETGDEG